MTDTHDGDTERKDPVLVRPYVKTEITSVAGAEAAETWPADAPLPDEADTLVQPVVPDEPPPPPPAPRSGMSLPVRLLVLVGGVALALAVGGYLIFGTGGETPPVPGVALPQLPANAPTGQAATSAPPSASTSPSPSASASSSASASASPSLSASASAVAPVTPSAAPTSATPTLVPPPASDRTGSVTAASGRCLALGSLLGMDGSPIQVNSCAKIAYQEFTLATDGTLKVNGRCAQPADGGTIRV
ncbi:MAG: hypothetical protein ABW046_07940, partial [Actinoplanes sp.]